MAQIYGGPFDGDVIPPWWTDFYVVCYLNRKSSTMVEYLRDEKGNYRFHRYMVDEQARKATKGEK